MRALFAVVALAAALLTACSLPMQDAPADATVKIISGQSHGSGFHIGENYIITAAHVVKDGTSVEITASDGQAVEADILWSSAEYDIALLRLSDPANLAAVPLSCRVPGVGEAIVSKGNPGGVEFVTVWGRVAGEEREFGPWKSVVVTDIATVPGQSGGPNLDTSGKVVGVTVGVLVSPLGLGASLVGIGFIVPAKTVCDLMARGG